MEAYASSHDYLTARNLHDLLKSFRTLSKGFNELDATRAISLSGIPPPSRDNELYREENQSPPVYSILPGEFGLTGPQSSDDSPGIWTMKWTRTRARTRTWTWTPIGSSRHLKDVVSDRRFNRQFDYFIHSQPILLAYLIR